MKHKEVLAHKIAKEVWSEIMKDLTDRRGIKNGFEDIDDDIMEEINLTQVSKIREGILKFNV